MVDAKDDTEFANAVIRFGFARLEQIEECLKLKERITRAGLKPKSLLQIMLAKGYITKEQADQIENNRGTSVDTRPAAAAAGQAPVEIPQKISGYRILQKIGEGAIGTVYKALQLSMDRVVAIKVLLPRYAANDRLREKFFSEARIAAKLAHPNIVQAIDVGQENGIYYFVMEYIDGPTVGHLLKRGGALDEKRVIHIVTQVAQALSYAHRHGVIHRDIKPDNIMLTREGTVKLCDLGLAKAIHDPDDVKAGIIVGTPYYLSPEQAKGDVNIDARADIYSLGAAFYHMVTGTVPFPGDNAVAVVTKHLTEPLEPPRVRQPLVSPAVNFVITKMMAKDREDRYQSADELIKDLEAIAAGGDPKGFSRADATRQKIKPRFRRVRRRFRR